MTYDPHRTKPQNQYDHIDRRRRLRPHRQGPFHLQPGSSGTGRRLRPAHPAEGHHFHDRSIPTRTTRRRERRSVRLRAGTEPERLYDHGFQGLERTTTSISRRFWFVDSSNIAAWLGRHAAASQHRHADRAEQWRQHHPQKRRPRQPAVPTTWSMSHRITDLTLFANRASDLDAIFWLV